MNKVKLSDVAEIIMGQSPKGTSYNDKKNGLPLLNGAADYKGQFFNPKQYTSEPTRIAQKGDIIFGIRGLKTYLNSMDKCLKKRNEIANENKTLLNRMATEDDIRGAIIFLATNMSSYITGQNIIIDGGLTIK